MLGRLKATLTELKEHAPFTLFGAATGVLAMLLFARASTEVSHRLFQVFHPGHVVLSAIVTASLFRLHERRRGFLVVLVVGYVGAIGVATLSDSVLPFLGESILGVAVPTHGQLHDHEAEHANDEHEDDQATVQDDGIAGSEKGGPASRPHIYLGFIEDWYLVNPAAFLGVLIAWFWPHTKFPHAGHILISTWASSFHVLMNTHRALSPTMVLGVFVVLFIAVWLPCCMSDIVFPMFFVRSPNLHVGHHHHHHGQEVGA